MAMHRPLLRRLDRQEALRGTGVRLPTLIVGLLSIGLSSCATGPDLAGDLAAELEVAGSVGPAATRVAVAKIELRNNGEVPLAFSRTFGFGAYHWIGLRIQTIAGEDLWYPEGIPDLVLELPDYECLEAGQSIELEIDLQDWPILFGGRAWEERLGFDLAPGQYRLRVQYTDARRRRIPRLRCAQFVGSAYSDWIPFEISSEAR
jgi:hypothetical protein